MRQAACQFPGRGFKKGALTVNVSGCVSVRASGWSAAMAPAPIAGARRAALAIRSGTDNAPTDAERTKADARKEQG